MGGESLLKGIEINLSDFENKPDFSHQPHYLIAILYIYTAI
jgi:hypothetical protein